MPPSRASSVPAAFHCPYSPCFSTAYGGCRPTSEMSRAPLARRFHVLVIPAVVTHVGPRRDPPVCRHRGRWAVRHAISPPMRRSGPHHPSLIRFVLGPAWLCLCRSSLRWRRSHGRAGCARYRRLLAPRSTDPWFHAEGDAVRVSALPPSSPVDLQQPQVAVRSACGRRLCVISDGSRAQDAFLCPSSVGSLWITSEMSGAAQRCPLHLLVMPPCRRCVPEDAESLQYDVQLSA